ncbi:glycosyltransferase family 2 protein [Haloarcula onubensis]|uniref:Glycosyltransferase family 2 protein n=1 Tax=Haloarcula onubensis TaxID=2950539 RepID=A0ABU2FKR5_9EURY|nr:glycosyltransferase family 2 protein [Halomicroarcula sp. S3CR25-11]MDS0280791.1 glycosyltransferase family 2 protein [Halomicroarcula sp. S3CR25-11]
MSTDDTVTAQASIVIVSYNHADFIEDCLRTAIAEEPAKIIVVDAGSTDGTIDIVTNGFPEVTLLTPAENGGYGASNNTGVSQIDTEYTVILNPDTKIEPDSLEALLAPLTDDNQLITTPKILTYEGDRINTCGNVDHFTGLGFTRGLHRPPTELSEGQYISGISGACFALRTELYRELSGFDEAIFLYMEDVELSWRAALNGIDILYVPDAVIYHDFEDVAVPAEKIYHVERGRYYILRKHLDTKTVAALLPSLLLTELLTSGYAVLSGIDGVRNKLRAIRDGLTMEINKVQKNPETVLSRLAAEIPENQLTYSRLDQFGKKFANAVYRLNYRLLNV